MMRILSSGRLAFFLGLLGFWTFFSTYDSAAQPNPAKTHKLRVNDPSLAREIIAKGGELIADYGSFQVLRADEPLAAAALGDPKVELVTRHNNIALNTGPLDTTVPAVQGLRVPAALTAGKRLHLLQFAGPIKPEWRDALEKTGVEIVTYI